MSETDLMRQHQENLKRQKDAISKFEKESKAMREDFEAEMTIASLKSSDQSNLAQEG